MWRAVSNVVGGVVDTFGALFDILTLDYFDNLTERINRMATAAADLVPDWLQNWLGSDDDKEVVVRNQEVAERRQRLAGGIRASDDEQQPWWLRTGKAACASSSRTHLPVRG